jgi:hypothetical protein
MGTGTKEIRCAECPETATVTTGSEVPPEPGVDPGTPPYDTPPGWAVAKGGSAALGFQFYCPKHRPDKRTGGS